MKEEKKLLINKDKYGGLVASFFIHGLFFAHEVEVNDIFTGTNNSFNKKIKNRNIWERYPK